jgi:hypothetical protein
MRGIGGFTRRYGRFRAGEDGGSEYSGLVAESYGMRGQVESIGILRCAQDDSED